MTDGGTRDSRVLVGAVGLSAGGDFLALIPLAALVSELSGSGWAVSGLFVALWGPMVLFASPAGKLVDRIETRGLLIVSSLVQAVIAAALILATDSVAAIIALVAVLGSVNAFSAPAEFALTGAVESELAGSSASPTGRNSSGLGAESEVTARSVG